MRSAPLEQRHRFIELSLAPPQFSQAHEPLLRHGRTRRGELVGGDGQLAFSLLPRAAPHAHRGVLRAAHGKQRPQFPFRTERLEPVAPLHRALIVANALARGNQVTAGETDQHPIAQFAGQHRGVHLVQFLKTLRDSTGRHARKAVERASNHLVIHRPERLTDPHGVRCEFFRFLRVSIVEQGEDTSPQRQPRMFCRIRKTLQQAMCPLQPPVRNCLLAPERRRVPGEPDGHPRRSEAVVAFTIQAVRAFAGVEHDVGQVEPPGGQAQTFERLGIFSGLQRRFERDAGGLPVATSERCPTGLVTADGSDRRDACAARILTFHDGLRPTDYQQPAPLTFPTFSRNAGIRGRGSLQGSRLKTERLPSVATKTLPLTTSGMLNFAALSSVSRAPAWSLAYNSARRSSAR